MGISPVFRFGCIVICGCFVALLFLGVNMAKVTQYTYAEEADNRPGFQLSRPPLDEDGVVRYRSNLARWRGGPRDSELVSTTQKQIEHRARVAL